MSSNVFLGLWNVFWIRLCLVAHNEVGEFDLVLLVQNVNPILDHFLSQFSELLYVGHYIADFCGYVELQIIDFFLELLVAQLAL